MARKNAPPAPPRPTRDRVRQLFDRGEVHAAYTAARLLHANEPTAEHLALLKKMIVAAAGVLTDGNKTTEFNKLMGEADLIDPANAEWAVERACLLARGGRLADALMRVDESARVCILGHGADRALKVQSKDFLPDDLHAGYDSIVAAFGYYEAEKDEDARAALEPIGLRSPFLEWKVLLRGLMAHAANDSARAAENFARLDHQRLPHRLASPYRTSVDPAWKASAAAELAKQYAKLNSSGIVEPLREIARHLGREKPLSPAFRAVEEVLPRLKRHAPHLLPRLADCLSHAMIRQGDVNDLKQFRKLFPAPADDPSFHRLHARIAEELHAHDVANQNWRRYEEWLATKPAGWPDALLQRVRALIWHHMGANGAIALERDEEAEPRPIVVPPGPSPLECFKRAVELAPDWDIASREYYGALTDEERYEEAEQVGRSLLAHHPDSLEPVLALADNLRKQKRLAESLEFLERALAINPLDRGIALQTAYGVVGLARSLLFSGKAEEAEACLAADRELLDDCLGSHRDALLAVIAMKRGDRAAAAQLMERVNALTVPRLGCRFRIAVDSLLAKLKPADRKAADLAFAEALNTPLQPLELLNLLVSYELYLDGGHAYRGQKTQLKKFVALAPATLTADAPEVDFEALARVLLQMHQDKIAKKFLTACSNRFRASPAFLVIQAELGLDTDEPDHVIRGWLVVARDLAEKSKDARHRELVPRINELLGRIPDPFAFIDSFFRGKF